MMHWIKALWAANREAMALREKLRAQKDGFYYEFYLRCNSLEDMVDKAMKLMPTADRDIIKALVEAANNVGYSEGQG